MLALFDDDKNLGLSIVATVVVEEAFLLVDVIFKLGFLENFFGWFNPQLTINGAMLSLAAFAGVLAVVWLTILFILHGFDVYNRTIGRIRWQKK